MDILNEVLGPIPIPLLALILFGLVFGFMLSRFLRMPAHFQMKEDLRDEIRFRLSSELVDEAAAAEEAEKARAEAKKTAASKEETAAPPPAAPPAGEAEKQP
ncbi:MAG: hypothetical protein FWB85_11275 [Chitinispirillia bacterium]|nr:hypothetical protein [Chitinispirillia bacterium]